ncbi:MAG: TonB-dependent receptor [Myxococcaceae bacterium]|nr:TonB-dependent receptor [Myxococcaceae bacterium]
MSATRGKVHRTLFRSLVLFWLGALFPVVAVAGDGSDEAPAQATITAARLDGRVQVRGDRRPIPGAILRIGNPERVVETDIEGRFSVSLPAGDYKVIVFASGYSEKAFTEILRDGEALEVVYRLERSGPSVYETRVTSQRERGELARVRLQGAELREVPGTQGEPLRVVTLLPGVSGLASGVSYPVVRGSAPAATGYFIDGVRVPQLFHLLLGPSVIHSEFLESMDFHPGLAPLRYGGLLGGVVHGRVSAPRDDRMRGSASVDLINAGAFLETPLGTGGPRVTLAGRLSYMPLLGSLVLRELTRPAPGIEGPELIADFWDYQGRIEQSVGDAKLRLLVLGSSDVVGSLSESPGAMSGLLRSRFHRADLRLRNPLGNGQFELGFTAGTEEMGAFAAQDGTDVVRFGLHRSNIAARTSWSTEFGREFSLRFGADIERASSDMEFSGLLLTRAAASPTDTFHAPALATASGVYSEATWTRGSIEISGGTRLDNYHLVHDINHTAVAPRLGARWMMSDSFSVSGAIGLVHQPPTVLLPVPVSDTAGLRQGLQTGAQADVAAAWQLSSDVELVASAYLTRLSRAVEYGIEQLVENRRRLSDDGDPGTRGRAWGLELMVRRPQMGRWFGWVTYSLQRSERFQKFYRFDDKGLPFGPTEAWVPYAFDQTHVFNATFGLTLDHGVRLGASFHFNTGRPESGQLTSRAQREGFDSRSHMPIWVPSDLDSEKRLPPFARLDLRVSKEWTFDDHRLELYLDVLNATVSQEVLGYTYAIDRSKQTEPLVRVPFTVPAVFPMIGVKGSF